MEQKEKMGGREQGRVTHSTNEIICDRASNT